MSGAPRQVSIAVPVEVEPSNIYPGQPFMAKVEVAGLRHSVFAETEEMAIRQIRDWVVSKRSRAELIRSCRARLEELNAIA